MKAARGGRSKSAALLQSDEEWGQRNEALSASMLELIAEFADFQLGQGLDIGCQQGNLTDMLAIRTGQRWRGIDPVLLGPTRSPNGADLSPGSADSTPFDDGEFDCLLFANVFEHIRPDRRVASLREMMRVLRPGGVIVGQIPNPYFPIESHSRLPFMGWLPIGLQRKYWKLSPVPWDHDFYVVTTRTLAAEAGEVGLKVTYRRNFNYPLEVIPAFLRPVARFLTVPMRSFPWAWQFVVQRPGLQEAGAD
jgi:SAM-dependent methyltransferase